MAGLIGKLLGAIRYRRRWRILAAAAEVAADKATTELDRHVRDRGRRHRAGQRSLAERPPASRIPRSG
ncbi:hypothetical protein [Roseicella aerolata]|uniref:Uncharacterized protein n=1 Tax=Roseicella aerolata TaxID=2883479 RepID=A0A9X1IFL8_9PROT|nr:hypothetical protein [Roseicella aerolata]MCB4823592.1 hypothetical protein [Roseicella aerolata]